MSQKATPLKGKVKKSPIGYPDTRSGDVRSAIEWLNQELDNAFRRRDLVFAEGSKPQILNEIINEAFEDVMEDEKERT